MSLFFLLDESACRVTKWGDLSPKGLKMKSESTLNEDKIAPFKATKTAIYQFEEMSLC